MKHYSIEQWIDFVNGTSAKAAQHEMQKHLDSGCKSCLGVVAMWRKVQSSAANEPNFEPPANVLRAVKAAFGNAGFDAKPGFTEVIAELVFDSFQSPAMAGARSTGMQSRQMLFSANPYQIDLNIETKPGETSLSVTGQLMDTSQPDSIGRGVLVTLSNRRGQTIQTVTNNFGEFHGEIENRGDLELTFPGKGEKPVVVSLRDALTYVLSPTRGADSRKPPA
ncbi:MAG TPA: hypothetical protein VN025_10690 [Candidatus Dormibacteraeota bacterium]|jgi:hypothetical protein|nr:hypothetical protein [Candidatus Dormibacteraeota bacterium]